MGGYGLAIAKLSDGKKLTKVCYYGTKAAGDEKLKKQRINVFS